MRDDFALAIMLLLAMILLYIMLVADTLDRRLMPRIVYVHQGGRDDRPEIIEPEPASG